jgi:hypothetical protein
MVSVLNTCLLCIRSFHGPKYIMLIRRSLLIDDKDLICQWCIIEIARPSLPICDDDGRENE